MAPTDPVPEADQLEQEAPPSIDPYRRTPEHLAAEEPEADVLEQELPLDVDEDDRLLPDADRVEPPEEPGADWLEEESGR